MLGIGAAPQRIRKNVVYLDLVSRVAAASGVPIDVAAATAVQLPHLSSHRRRNRPARRVVAFERLLHDAAEARDLTLECKRAALRGDDPRAVRGRRGVTTFGEAAEKVIALHARGWKGSGKTEDQWRASLRDHAAALAPMQVDKITASDILAVSIRYGTGDRRRHRGEDSYLCDPPVGGRARLP